ncbi:MAG: CRISPR-associated endonuclease Cas2 [Firmicutes bacterium]|nr:CRISPR-associated endonuclease Cas2 [Alicyclobacillaceae bacterium]MCL6498050.1 CRISPR-associated endonuclease Cas2 [Bacillota bacterium]
MFVILVYDAQAIRDPKVLRTCRKYLDWIQNSVFEGELTEVKLKKLRTELSKIIDPKRDYIVCYAVESAGSVTRSTLGTPKTMEGNIF